jgi:predicted nuclease of predicted toxin-antitoxin system
VAGDVVMALREKGHDVFWARTDAPGSNDSRLMALARTENRILVTFDVEEHRIRTRPLP